MSYKHRDILADALQHFSWTTPGGAYLLMMFHVGEADTEILSNLKPAAQIRVIEQYLAHVRASQ